MISDLIAQFIRVYDFELSGGDHGDAHLLPERLATCRQMHPDASRDIGMLTHVDVHVHVYLFVTRHRPMSFSSPFMKSKQMFDNLGTSRNHALAHVRPQKFPKCTHYHSPSLRVFQYPLYQALQRHVEVVFVITKHLLLPRSLFQLQSRHTAELSAR